ncbi:MAG: response regulator, partial [Candidatus Reddybacter sp.]
HGTQMVFYFPRDRFIDHGKKIKIITEELTHSWQATILIADDELALLVLSQEILSQRGYRVIGLSGYRVIAVENAHDALEVMNKESIDLLISDVIMPDMDGFQLLAIVHGKHHQVITQLASGFTGEHHTNDIIDNHSQDILHKPYSAKTLLKRVSELLARNSTCLKLP